MSDTSKHAILSPSGADRWMTCPGSVVLSQDIPDKPNVYSTEGTDMHEVAALCLEEQVDAETLIGKEMLSEALLTEDQAKHVQTYVNVVRLYKESIPNAVLRVEERVPLAFLTGEKDAEGTADALIISSDPELIVIDAKFGHSEVIVERNRQLMIYGLGALEKHELWDTTKTVRLVICQPRTTGTKEWVTTIEEMKAFAEEVRFGAKRVFAEPDMLNPSEKACKFCRAKAICPAIGKMVDSTVFDGFEVEWVAVDGKAVGAGVESPDSLALKMSRIPMIENWIKEIRAEVERRLLKGEGIPGWKLVKGKRGNREWDDEIAVETWFKTMKYKVAEMYKMTLITPTVAEKLLAKEKPKHWKDVSERITQKEGGLSVAPQSDERPAIVIGAPEDGFEVEAAEPSAENWEVLL